ncbi:SPOR domain-containing protein [Rhodothermus marinus]|uniref:SPOR domain-containing protein n=1 Tax=Rhodothermus marinus TaxID=29549 RepID=UPI0012BA5253|nr:SPOR domain-containing protein [Rhodothermus marinus]BBM69835.1 hypothetical protein RmaAA213_16810 [Rhodothermus marinus]
MPASLIQQLAERLGCTPEAAEAALRQYVARIQEQLEREGRASLPGLGLLVRSEEGLRFEPDASLAQAVNHRFAGLEPVVVEPPSAQAYRKTEVVPPEGEETEASKELETAEEVSTSPFYEVEPETPRVEVPPPTESPEEVEEAASAVEEAPTTPPPEPEPEPEPEASAESAEPTPPSPEPSLRPPRPPRFRVEEERRRGLPVWVPAALLIVVLGAVAVWFLLFSRPSEPEVVPPAPSQAEVQPTAPAETTAAAATPAADTAAETSTPTVEAPPPPAPPAPGDYALIVGSVTSQTAAERIAERFRRALAERGLPVTIVATTTGGTTRYRVAVGRYGSPEEALAAKRQLGNVLPPDAWVFRVPSTTQ